CSCRGSLRSTRSNRPADRARRWAKDSPTRSISAVTDMAGAGIFFDGITSVRQNASVELAEKGLRITAADGRLLADWPYPELVELNAPDGVLRLGRRGNAALARLE